MADSLQGKRWSLYSKDVKELGFKFGKMGQMWDLLRLGFRGSVHLVSASQNVLKTNLKSPIFVQYWANLIDFVIVTALTSLE